jgi:hypothetical protein
LNAESLFSVVISVFISFPRSFLKTYLWKKKTILRNMEMILRCYIDYFTDIICKIMPLFSHLRSSERLTLNERSCHYTVYFQYHFFTSRSQVALYRYQRLFRLNANHLVFSLCIIPNLANPTHFQWDPCCITW